MTKREKFLMALRNKSVEGLVWAPNFDYWLNVNSAEGTLPEQYIGMSRNDIVRAIGGTIWNRTYGLKPVLDSSIVTRNWEEDGHDIQEYHTPTGSVRQVMRPTEGQHRSKFLSEHLVKDLDSLKVMTYIVEGTHYEPNYEEVQTALDETGDDGVVLAYGFSVPFIQFAKYDAGYMTGLYMWMDNREEVDRLIQAYMRQYMEAYQVAADGPADVIATGDNMDGVMISPDIFREYAIPFYQEAKKITSSKGKIFEGHWCGRTQNLLPLTPGCGLDVVEAIVSKPMADIEFSEALDLLRGEVVLQGGIPSVLVCEQGGTRKDFEKHVAEVILPLKGRRGFILGMSDNVPPDADFARVEAVAQMIA